MTPPPSKKKKKKIEQQRTVCTKVFQLAHLLLKIEQLF